MSDWMGFREGAFFRPFSRLLVISGNLTISSIGDYVKKRVQDLTRGKQNPNLRGVNLEEDFTLGMAK